MFLIGLTGGIAAGKSTVANLWQELGAIEIDADKLAREVVEPGSIGAHKILEEFGAEYFDANGELIRRKLGELVFSNPAQRRNLENIIHPLVRNRAQELLASLPSNSMVIYTVPLLVEAKVDLPFDVVVTVEAPEDVRLGRLVTKRGLSLEEASARIGSQAKPVERAQVSDFVLNSNQSLDLLLADARTLWQKFSGMAQSK